MARKSMFYIIGYRIGYWFASHRDRLIREGIATIVRSLPGGRWLMRIFH